MPGLPSSLSRGLWVATLTALSAGAIGRYLVRERGAVLADVTRARVRNADASTGNYLVRRGATTVGVGKVAYAAEGDTVDVIEDTRLQLSVPGGGVQRVVEIAHTRLDARLRVLRFDIQITAGGHGRPAQRSTVTARRVGADSLELRVGTGGRETVRMVAVPEGFVVGQSLWPRLAISGALIVGTRLTAYDFDPIALAVRPTFVRVTGVDTVPRRQLPGWDPSDPRQGRVRVYHVTQESGGLKYALDVQDNGLVLRSTLPAGLTVEAVAPEVAGRAFGRFAVGDQLSTRAEEAVTATQQAGASGTPEVPGAATLVAASAIQAAIPGATRRDAAHARPRALAMVRLVVRTTPTGADTAEDASLAHTTDLEGGVQHVRGDTVTIVAGVLDGSGNGERPAGTPGARTPIAAGELRAAREEEPFIERDDPAIVAAAERAVAGVAPGDTAGAVRAITHWTWSRLAKVYTASLPSARQTLLAGEGDCTEHAVLATALLRARGIAARPVVGLAAVGDQWYFHAWVEVGLGGGWQPIDPTFDEAPALAGHLRLFVGRTGMTRILPLLGALQLRVIEATEAPAPSGPVAAGPARDPAGRQPHAARRGAPGRSDRPPPAPATPSTPGSTTTL